MENELLIQGTCSWTIMENEPQIHGIYLWPIMAKDLQAQEICSLPRMGKFTLYRTYTKIISDSLIRGVFIIKIGIFKSYFLS